MKRRVQNPQHYDNTNTLLNREGKQTHNTNTLQQKLTAKNKSTKC